MSTETIITGVAHERRTRHFSVEEFRRMFDAGILSERERVELVEGGIVDMMAPNAPHSYAVQMLNILLSRVLSSGYLHRVQDFVELNRTSLVSPDLAVVQGPASRYQSAQPKAADVALIIEVADTPLRYDLSTKRDLYAAAGVPVYWVIDLPGKQVHVLTDPRDGAYQTSHQFNGDAQIDVQLAGQSIGSLKASDFLPA